MKELLSSRRSWVIAMVSPAPPAMMIRTQPTRIMVFGPPGDPADDPDATGCDAVVVGEDAGDGEDAGVADGDV